MLNFILLVLILILSIKLYDNVGDIKCLQQRSKEEIRVIEANICKPLPLYTEPIK